MPYANRDIPIYYTELGQGDPILFLHGAGGNSTIWWQQFQAFAPEHRCVALDHRGFGRSPCGKDAFDVARYGDDALAVMDAAGIERAHVVCQSMGGWTGVQLALSAPDRVRSLVLGDTIGGINLPSGVQGMGPIIEKIKQIGGSNVALGKVFRTQEPERAHLYREISAFNTVIRSLDLYGQMFRPDVLQPLDRAATIQAPVMIVAGSDDAFWPPHVLRELSEHIPGSELAELESGHSPYYEIPDAFNTVLRDFLTRH